MALLMLFALVAGAGTALSACVLPLVPAVLSAGVTGGRRRPLGLVTGLALSFTSATVAPVNERARPVTRPSGRRRPPVTPADSTAGTSGSTHADKAVPAPATSANSISSAIWIQTSEVLVLYAPRTESDQFRLIAG